jgi:alkylhydroperoxidase family enzyme
VAYIKLVEPGDAEGPLKAQYDAAIARAGFVWNIVKTMSPNPPVLDASMRLYGTAMKGPSPLTRVQREMLAVVVSATNDCFY